MGAMTIAATVVATFYTAASDALVSPHLRTGTSTKVMSGEVWKTYANRRAQNESCPGLIYWQLDEDYGGLTCAQLVLNSVCKIWSRSSLSCSY